MQRADQPALFVSAESPVRLEAEQSASRWVAEWTPSSSRAACWLAGSVPADLLAATTVWMDAFLLLAGSQDGQPRSITRRS